MRSLLGLFENHKAVHQGQDGLPCIQQPEEPMRKSRFGKLDVLEKLDVLAEPCMLLLLAANFCHSCAEGAALRMHLLVTSSATRLVMQQGWILRWH